MDKEVEKILEYYGARLDDSGEPDEAPEAEGIVTFPTPDEEKQAHQEWQTRVENWKGGYSL